LCDAFVIQNGVKSATFLSLLCFSFALECAIGKIQEKHKRLEVNGIHQLLLCDIDDNVNLLVE
jgi:hypothetical protein